MRAPSFPRVLACVCALASAAALGGSRSRGGAGPTYDVVIRGGTIYDGTGAHRRRRRRGHRRRPHRRDRRRRPATRRGRDRRHAGLAVAPGFINMLSWADRVADRRRPRRRATSARASRSRSSAKAWSMGPLNDAMKKDERRAAGRHQVRRSTGRRSASTSSTSRSAASSPNVASFVGATTVRIHEVGYDDRAPTPEELERMQALVRQAMEEGALGVGSSLIYAPGVLREDRRADRAVQGAPPSTAACTSRTCAARATGCSKRSTS